MPGFFATMKAINRITDKLLDIVGKDGETRELTRNIFILIRREDSHFNEAKWSKWEMNRLNYILLKIG